MDDNKMIIVKLTDEKKTRYTVAEIMEEAKKNFNFQFNTSTNGGKLHGAIKKQIERKLKDKRSYGKGTRNRMYSRGDVYRLLDNELYGYFLKISQKKNKQDYESLKEKSDQLADKPLQGQKEAESSREKLSEQLEKLKFGNDPNQMLQILMEVDAGIWSEEEIKAHTDKLIDMKKREIFFEFLYEHLFDLCIDFYAERYQKDLEIKSEAEGDSLLDTAEMVAIDRLKDNHRYYRSKLPPDALKELLAKIVNGVDSKK